MRNKIYIIILAFLVVGAAASAQNMSVSTNIADYANLGTFNAEASYAFARHWSINAGVKYNPFSFGDGDRIVQSKQRSIAMGARFWPWHIYSGWWLSGKVRFQEYNTGTSASEYTAEGDRLGGSLAGGYSYMLNAHLNLEVGLGAWAGYDNYVRYSCPRCGRVVGEGSRFFLLPDDIVLSFSYVF